jgi:hypothetical protein
MDCLFFDDLLPHPYLSTAACDAAIVATTFCFVLLFLIAFSSMIIVTVRVGWQDDMMQLDPEGTTGESEQQDPNAVQDGENNTDSAPEQLVLRMDEPVNVNGPENVLF